MDITLIVMLSFLLLLLNDKYSLVVIYCIAE
ncbi:hypothetical protein C825_000259 [Parabacteroides sp. ASF519]|uniref:Uncharacterized protein n=2 Tax=Parabacteroides goldsteinii TaxID=328812 RepID=S0GG32_9BACT|nr:hypothetical protein C803_03860 [Parabacteroides goldsteinii dnLKV18]KAI4358236.1 hypothetical protein C825_000259 [Parabacteroides sp. ASF519]KKB55906.1 hypothetical protein HMPREF1535_01878 [Parabacteroides goldsteinii DSM 19448 = WAL 12034]